MGDSWQLVRQSYKSRQRVTLSTQRVGGISANLAICSGDWSRKLTVLGTGNVEDSCGHAVLLIGYSGVIVWWRRSRLCRDGVILACLGLRR